MSAVAVHAAASDVSNATLTPAAEEPAFEDGLLAFYPFNGNVRDYRNKCQSFPSNIIAGAFGFEAKDYFSVPPSVRDVPNADFG